MARDDLDDLLDLDDTPTVAASAAETNPIPDDLLGDATTGTEDEGDTAAVLLPDEPAPAVVEASAPEAPIAAPEPVKAPQEAAEAKPKVSRPRRTAAQIEADLRAQIETEMRAKIEAEYAERIAPVEPADRTGIVDATTVPSQAADPRTMVELPAVQTEPVEADEEDEEAQLARLLSKRLAAGNDSEGRPLPDAQVSPEIRALRSQQDALARKAGIIERDASGQIAPAKFEPVKDIDDPNTLVIHIVNDGLILNGVPAYRGQTFAFDLNGRAYEQTKDRFGRSFLDLVDDIDAQYEKWGDQKIARGPWRGKKSGFTVKDAPSDLRGDDRLQWVADMEAAMKAEERRGYSAPVMQGIR